MAIRVATMGLTVIVGMLLIIQGGCSKKSIQSGGDAQSSDRGMAKGRLQAQWAPWGPWDRQDRQDRRGPPVAMGLMRQARHFPICPCPASQRMNQKPAVCADLTLSRAERLHPKNA